MHEEQRRKDAAHPTVIEANQREVTCRYLCLNDASNQVAGDHEEHVDPDEASVDVLGEAEVKENDGEHGKCPQSVDVASVHAGGSLANRRRSGSPDGRGAFFR